MIIGSRTVLPHDSLVVIGSTTLTPGQVITISSDRISPSNSALVIDTSIVSMTSNVPFMTIKHQPIPLPSPGSRFIIARATITTSQAVTVSDTPISLEKSAVAIGTSTIPLVPEEPSATIAGQLITPPKGSSIDRSTFSMRFGNPDQYVRPLLSTDAPQA